MSKGLFALAVAAGLVSSPLAAEQVFRVGSWRGVAGTHVSIQAAVDAASPGDWILIAPGDYHETGRPNAGVLIAKPNLHLRGLDRNGVVVDGTQPGARPCSAAAMDQVAPAGGRNGIVALKVDGVSIENLTVCNFLDDGSGAGGNQVWWNGGDGSGVIGMGSFRGAYLTASSSFASANAVPLYGVFASNSRGPGAIEASYASNMADSGFYVGACPDCDTALRFVHAQNNAQGFSGTNAGGRLVIEDSEWDGNRVGLNNNTLAADDSPSPQNGACPGDPKSRCTIIRRNDIHHNNNPDTPGAGLAGGAPTGTGLLVSGGRNDLVTENWVHDNGAWGVLVTDYPDVAAPNGPSWCAGGVPNFQPSGDDAAILGPLVAALGGAIPCYFHAFGTKVSDNRFARNAGFGNPGNADVGNFAVSYALGNCYSDNVSAGGPRISSAPLNIQSEAVLGRCGRPYHADVAQQSTLSLSLLCDTFFAGAPACASFNYPQPTQTRLTPIPKLAGMPRPCDGVPVNPWCPAKNEDDKS